MNLERTYRFDCPACGETLSAVGQPGKPEVIERQKRGVIQYHLMTACERQCSECRGHGWITTVIRCPSGPNDTRTCWTCNGEGWVPAPAVPDNVVVSDN